VDSFIFLRGELKVGENLIIASFAVTKYPRNEKASQPSKPLFDAFSHPFGNKQLYATEVKP
jgi:hypothetical protein